MDLRTLKEKPPWDWPEGTDKRLLEILTDDRADGSDRLLAAEFAGDFTMVNDELVSALLSILQNNVEPEKLRALAVISLGPAIEHADTNGFEDPDDILITEQTFLKIQRLLPKLYTNTYIPKELRRRILEASVRAPQDWHWDAIRSAYSCDDKAWNLTAVFAMRWIRGFDDQILEALESNDENVHYQAVCAAGGWEIDAAWSHVSGLLNPEGTEKELLLAAIDAAAAIRPQEAGMILVDLTHSEDEDIVEAAHEAMAMAEGLLEEELDEYEDEAASW